MNDKQTKRDLRPKFTNLVQGMEDSDLRIEIFTLCEGAVEQNGRLSMLGTYDVLHSQCFPLVLPQMTVVIRLRFWPGEARHHRVRLTMVDPDGRVMGAEAEAMINVNGTEEGLAAPYNLIVHMQAIEFEEPGEHAIAFHLDDALEGRLPFCVHRSQQGAN